MFLSKKILGQCFWKETLLLKLELLVTEAALVIYYMSKSNYEYKGGIFTRNRKTTQRRVQCDDVLFDPASHNHILSAYEE